MQKVNKRLNNNTNVASKDKVNLRPENKLNVSGGSNEENCKSKVDFFFFILFLFIYCI